MGVKIHESAVELIKSGSSDIKRMPTAPVGQMVGAMSGEQRVIDGVEVQSEADIHKLNQKVC